MRSWGTVWMVAVLLTGTGARAGDNRTTRQPARLRSGPGVVHPIQQKIEQGTELTVLEDGRRWLKVEMDTGEVGWVSSRVFDEPAPPAGYGKVLTEQGLEGATSTVVTMAARGLVPTAAGGAGAHALLYDFFDRAPVDPIALESLLAELGADDSCPAQEGSLVAARRQLEGSTARDDLEVRLGKAVAARLLAEHSLVTDPAMDAYVNLVGVAVARRSGRYDLPWRFVLFEEKRPAVLSLPGGMVLVASGLLPALSDESELAGVLGQAIAHVSLGHGASQAADALERATRQGESGSQRFTRLVDIVGRLAGTSCQEREELDADALGMALAACAGYDPGGLGRAYQIAPALTGRQAPDAEGRVKHLEEVRRQAELPAGKRFAARYRSRLADW